MRRSRSTALSRGDSSSSKPDSMIPPWCRPRNHRRPCSRSRTTDRSIFLLRKTVCSRDNILRPCGMCSSWDSFLHRHSTFLSPGYNNAPRHRGSRPMDSNLMAQHSRIPCRSLFRGTHSTSLSTGHSILLLRSVFQACRSSRSACSSGSSYSILRLSGIRLMGNFQVSTQLKLPRFESHFNFQLVITNNEVKAKARQHTVTCRTGSSEQQFRF